MHQIVLFTAMTATTGLFGGHRHCQSGHCPTAGYAVYAPSAGCPQGTACAVRPTYAAPTTYAAPAPVAAARTVAPAPRTAYYYPSYYYPTVQSCPNGTCSRR